jgi:hypothetical protein
MQQYLATNDVEGNDSQLRSTSRCDRWRLSFEHCRLRAPSCIDATIVVESSCQSDGCSKFRDGSFRKYPGKDDPTLLGCYIAGAEALAVLRYISPIWILFVLSQERDQVQAILSRQ